MVWQHLMKLDLDYIDTHQPSDTTFIHTPCEDPLKLSFLYERSGLLLAPLSSGVPSISVPSPIRGLCTQWRSLGDWSSFLSVSFLTAMWHFYTFSKNLQTLPFRMTSISSTRKAYTNWLRLERWVLGLCNCKDQHSSSRALVSSLKSLKSVVC